MPSPLGTALITGASSGIGATYADRLARRGYDLILVARNAQRLQALSEKLTREAAVKVSILPADLTDRAAARTVEARLRDDDSVTMLVNNAGIGPKGTLLDDDLDYLDTMIELNVVAANRLAVAAAQAFAARGRGTIVNIASVVAYIPERFNGTYSATKAFVLNLTQAIHSEVSGKGVRVQAVLPGLTRTEIFERVGGSFDQFPASMVMDVTDMVDAALAGLDLGELVTIPSLPHEADLKAATEARLALGPNLSHDKPAGRYSVSN